MPTMRCRSRSSESAVFTLWLTGSVETIKVSARSSPNSVAAAMVSLLRQDRSLEVSVVGAGALNQAIKAVAIARPQLTPDNIDIVLIPAFTHIDIDGVQRTGLSLHVEHRPPPIVDVRDESLDSGIDHAINRSGVSDRRDVPWAR
jgi:stage V sporulation protein S